MLITVNFTKYISTAKDNDNNNIQILWQGLDFAILKRFFKGPRELFHENFEDHCS